VRFIARADGRRAVTAAADEVEHMRELVAVIETHFGGRASGAALPSTSAARSAQSWAQQNCARALADLRDAVVVLARTTAQLRAAPAVLGVAGRGAVIAQQLDGSSRELAARLDRFAVAPDAASAATALRAFADQVNVVGRSANVR
jgi:hypothetical protein